MAQLRGGDNDDKHCRISLMVGRARAQVEYLTTDAGVRSYTRLCGVCGGRSGYGPFFPSRTSVFSFHRHIPYSYSCMDRLCCTIYNVIVEHSAE